METRPSTLSTPRPVKSDLSSGPTDCTRLSARDLAAAIAQGRISAGEAVEAHIARIEQVNPALNAVVVKRYDAARAEARRADLLQARGAPLGPLHGVPVTIKEALDLAGTPSTFGLPARAHTKAVADDLYVARLRAAGAIILGKTNVAQLLFYYESDNPLYGRTNNPWNPDRTPGGSSGGEAAIIAAGGAPLGLGTDLGGSLRVPATFCGIASLKPTAGRTPDAGCCSAPLGQRAIVSQVGVLAREVGDVALGLDVITASHNPASESSPPFGNPTTVNLARLRVACYADDGTFAVSPAVRRAVQEATEYIRAAGAHVTPWTPPGVEEAIDLFQGILGADGFRWMADLLAPGKRDPRLAGLLFAGARSQPTLALLRTIMRALGQAHLAHTMGNFGSHDTRRYWQLVEAQMAYQERFAAALDSAPGGPFDVVISPACALPALTHGASGDLMTIGGYTALYNVLGYPAGVVPVTTVRSGEEGDRPATRDKVDKVARRIDQGSTGLPVGVQVVARPWQEHLVLASMQTIEAAAMRGIDYPATPHF
jgi:fatty acid amide hydrolase